MSKTKISPSDVELHARFLTGDKSAASTLVQRRYREILMFFHRRLPTEADDLAQSVFEVYVKSPEKVKNTNLRAYLYGVARNKLLHALRWHGRHPTEQAELTLLKAVGPGVSTIVGGSVAVQKLLTALQSLPVEQQTIIELCLKGFSMQDIALVLEKNANTCKGLKRKAVSALKGEFGEIGLSPRDAVIAFDELELSSQTTIREIISDDHSLPDE